MGARFVHVQTQDFDPGALQESLLGGAVAGAIATFSGCVRREPGDTDFEGLFLEHYPAMTEVAIAEILDEAATRWSIVGAGVVHRVGMLAPGARIVWVGVAAAHRAEAFAACEFIMDYLKTRAPFWKKEQRRGGGHWVLAREADENRAARWRQEC